MINPYPHFQLSVVKYTLPQNNISNPIYQVSFPYQNIHHLLFLLANIYIIFL